MRSALPLAALLISAAHLGGCATSECCSVPSAESHAEIAHTAHENFVNAINSNDLETLMSVLTDDVVLMAPNAPRLVGKDVVRPWAGGYYDAYETHWVKTTLEFVIAGDWAFEQYSYESTDTPRAGGPVVRDTGKGIAVFRRGGDGKWRVARDAWSSDLPAQ